MDRKQLQDVGEGVSCSVDTGRAIAAAGLHPASGGDGALLCSGNLRELDFRGATIESA